MKSGTRALERGTTMTTKTELLQLPSGNVGHLIAAQAAEIERLADALREMLERAQRYEALLRKVL